MTPLRVVVRPVNHTSLWIRTEFTVELDRIALADSGDARRQVDMPSLSSGSMRTTVPEPFAWWPSMRAVEAPGLEAGAATVAWGVSPESDQSSGPLNAW
jgi:hypothetical protein